MRLWSGFCSIWCSQPAVCFSLIWMTDLFNGQSATCEPEREFWVFSAFTLLKPLIWHEKIMPTVTSDPFLRSFSLLHWDFLNMLNNFIKHRWTMGLLPTMLSAEVLGRILSPFSHNMKFRKKISDIPLPFNSVIAISKKCLCFRTNVRSGMTL